MRMIVIRQLLEDWDKELFRIRDRRVGASTETKEQGKTASRRHTAMWEVLVNYIARKHRRNL